MLGFRLENLICLRGNVCLQFMNAFYQVFTTSQAIRLNYFNFFRCFYVYLHVTGGKCQSAVVFVPKQRTKTV